MWLSTRLGKNQLFLFHIFFAFTFVFAQPLKLRAGYLGLSIGIVEGFERIRLAKKERKDKLSRAILQNRLGDIQRFSEKEINAPLDTPDSNSSYPIHLAAANPKVSVDTLNLLIQKGADISQLDFDKRSPLFLAARYGHADRVKALIIAFQDKILESAVGTAVETAERTLRATRGEAEKAVTEKPVLRTVAGPSSVLSSERESRFFDQKSAKAGVTALHIAANFGHSHVINLLLAGGASDAVLDNKSHFALYYAAKKGHVEAAKAFISRRHRPRQGLPGDHEFITQNFLFPAVVQSDELAVLTLLKGGADPNERLEDGQYLLHLAIQKCTPPIVGALLEAGARDDIRNSEGKTTAQMAVERGSFPILQHLVRNQKERNLARYLDDGGKMNVPPLHLAVDRDNSMELIQYLLEKGASSSVRNELGMTPLQYAASHYQLPAVRALLAYHGARQGEHLAGQVHDLVTRSVDAQSIQWILKSFKDAGLDINNTGATHPPSLCLAAKVDNRPMTNALIQAREDLNQTDADGWTPLHWAAARNRVEIAETLLQAGARDDLVDRNGFTPFQLAIKHGSLSLVNKLIEKHKAEKTLQALLDNKGPQGQSVLQLVASRKDEQTMREMAKWTSMDSPSLEFLVPEDVVLGIARTLIIEGVDPYIKDARGFVLFNRALRMNDLAMLGAMISYSEEQSDKEACREFLGTKSSEIQQIRSNLFFSLISKVLHFSYSYPDERALFEALDSELDRVHRLLGSTPATIKKTTTALVEFIVAENTKHPLIPRKKASSKDKPTPSAVLSTSDDERSAQELIIRVLGHITQRGYSILAIAE